MAKASSRKANKSLINGKGRKVTSVGRAGRGRAVKLGMSTMNKSKKRNITVNRGQG
tara:strand:+ start:255 stop:422 length:168 start_codon:yes stop_codon:yes gene_type:complete